MAPIKSLSFAAIALAVAVVAVNSSSIDIEELKLNVVKDEKPHNLIIGQRQNKDILAYQENISVGASMIGKKVIFEKTFNAIKGHVITQVRALDQATDGTGAFAVVTAGGPGQESITLRFKSQRFHGIYFVVQLFAKPN